MEKIEQQLVESMVKYLLESDSPLYFKKLCALSNCKLVSEWLIRRIEHCENAAQKLRLVLIYVAYAKFQQSIIETFPREMISEHLRVLICETPGIEKVNESIDLCFVMSFFLERMSDIKPHNAISKIRKWGAERSFPLMYSLSCVHSSMAANFVSHLCLYYNDSVSTHIIAAMFLEKHKISELGEDVVHLIEEYQIMEKLEATFKNYMRSNANRNVTVGFRLLRGILHFFEDSDVLRLCDENLDSIIAGMGLSDTQPRYTSKTTVAAVQALCELPVLKDDWRKHFEMFVPLLSQHVYDFGDSVANSLVEFCEPRVTKEQLMLWTQETLRTDGLTQAALLLVCRYNFVVETQDLIFPENCANVIEATAVRSAVYYLSVHQMLPRELIPKAIHSILSSKLDIDAGLGLPATLEAIFNAGRDCPSVIFRSIMENMDIIDNKTYNIVSMLSMAFVESCNKELEISWSELFIQQFYNCLVKYIHTPVDSVDSERIHLQMLSVISTVVTGKIVPVDSIKSLSVASICDVLVPAGSVNALHELALTHISEDLAANVICVSLRNASKPNPVTVHQGINEGDAIDETIFERFYRSAGTVNRSAAIVEFTRTIAHEDENKSWFPSISEALSMIWDAKKPKYSNKLILRTIKSLVAPDIDTENASALFAVFNRIVEQNTESLDAAKALCKIQQKVEIGSEMLDKLINGYFADVLPDLVRIVDLTDELITRCFDVIYAEYHIDQYSAFCESCFACLPERSFQLLLSSLLKSDNDTNFVKFAEYLCKTHSNRACNNIQVFVVRLISHLLSKNNPARECARKSLCYLFSIEDSGSEEDLHYGELVLNVKSLFQKICSAMSDNLVSDVCKAMAESNKLSFVYAIFIHETVTAKPEFTCNTQLLEYMMAKGNSKNIKKKHIVADTIKVIALRDVKSFLRNIMTLKLNDFGINCILDLVRNEELRVPIIDYFVGYFVNFRIDNDESLLCARYQLFKIICTANTDMTVDFVLVWLIIANFATIASSTISLDAATTALCGMNTCMRAVFDRLQIPFKDFEEWVSCLDIAKMIATSLMNLSYSDLVALLSARERVPIKKQLTPSHVAITIGLVLIYLLTLMKNTKHPIVQKLTNNIGFIFKQSRDDVARILSAEVVKVMKPEDFALFEQVDLKRMMKAGMHALTKPDKDLRSLNVQFFAQVLSVTSLETIRKSQANVLQKLTESFEFCKIEDILDAIQRVILSEPQMEEFLSMAQISLTRILTLSVNETKTIREQATQILVLVSGANDKSEIIQCLTQRLGIRGVFQTTEFFIDWASKPNLNSYRMDMLLQMVTALKHDEEIKFKLINKAFPVLSPILGDIKNPLHTKAAEIMTTLFS